jgi:hypothetical protein
VREEGERHGSLEQLSLASISDVPSDVPFLSTREALRHKIRRNQRCGKVRFGFDLAADGKTLIPNEAEQEAIAVMTGLRAKGRTLRQIAAELTSCGVRTKEGGAWTRTAVARILDRKAAA